MTKFGTPFLYNSLRVVLTLVLLAGILAFNLHFKEKIQSRATTVPSSEALYLPDIKGLELLAVGYDQVLSHFLWFKTINYFGKELRGEKNYRYLSHLLNLVITLNPRLDYVYQFGVMMLSWETNQPNEALALLDKAVLQFPDSWYFLHLRGFTKLYFLQQPLEAQKDYQKAASLPDTPDLIKQLASKNLGAISSKFAAMNMLKSLIATAPDEQTKQILKQKLRELMNTKVNESK